MASETRFSASRSLGRSSIPVLIASHPIRAVQAPSNPELKRPSQSTNERLLYRDSDIQEHPPDGSSAPIIAFPGDDATNRAVKEYLLSVLTKTGWGIAVESGKEIRETINSFVGNGWALRKYYAESRLKDICPLYLTAFEDGVPMKRKIDASTRSNISKCIMREMERYFEIEKEAQNGKQDARYGENTLVTGSSDSCVRQSYDIASEGEEVQQFRQRPLSRATLPDDWMSESLRARTKSRASERSEERPTPVLKLPRSNRQSVFISKTSAFPLQVDIISPSQRRRSISSTTHNRLPARGRRPKSRFDSVGTSTYKRNSMFNPYHTIPGSSLPRPTTPSGNSSITRATSDVERSTLKHSTSYEFVGNVGYPPYKAKSTTSTPDTPAESTVSAQYKTAGLTTDANEDASATSRAMYPSTKDHGNTANVTDINERPTPANSENNTVIENTSASHPTDAASKPSQILQHMPSELEGAMHTLPPTISQPMTTLPPSPPNVYKDVPEDLDAKTTVLPVSGSSEWGNVGTANDFSLGSKSRRITVQEVEEAHARTENAAAARQQVALTKAKGRVKRWFGRTCGKIKMRKHGRPEVSHWWSGKN